MGCPILTGKKPIGNPSLGAHEVSVGAQDYRPLELLIFYRVFCSNFLLSSTLCSS